MWIAVTACGGDDNASNTPSNSATAAVSTASPTIATATATASPTPVHIFGTPLANFADFRDFAGQIASAIQDKDASFFLQDPVIHTEDCSSMGCASGTVSGVDFGGWLGEASPYSIDTLHGYLAYFFDAQAKLFGIAAVHSDRGGAIGGPATFAVLTANTVTSASVVVLEFIHDGNLWRLKQVMEAGSVREQPSEWLSGACAQCYDYFEPWQGATS